MKRRFARIALSVFVVIVMVSGAAFAADKAAKKSDTKDPKAQQDAMMEMMMKAAAPGPMHELLKPMAGNWKTTAKSWMQPGAEPQVSEGTCESTWILGNRYLQSTYKGDMGGMPFEGVGIMGYDNMKKEFVSTWMDNMGTGVAMSEGTADASGKVLTMKSMMGDPQTGKMVPYKFVTKVMDENTYTMTMMNLKGGKEQTEMEITYTRMK
jgi:hypothetical protein